MDLNALREAAIEATARALYEKTGFVPSEESDEWEAEYRRQFALLKERAAVEPAAPSRPAPPTAGRGLPELSGTPEQQRWAAAIRDERLGEIAKEPFRAWLARAWTRAKLWIDTREVPSAVLMQRLMPQFEEGRKQAAAAAQARTAERRRRQEAEAAYRRRLDEAGITPEGLVELVDASDRFDPAPIAAKLAEVAIEGRHLRIYETADPNLLLVKEKKGPLAVPDYAIERDEGLVGDLRLFAQAP